MACAKLAVTYQEADLHSGILFASATLLQVRVEVDKDAVIPGAKLSVRTVAASTVSYLEDEVKHGAEDKAEFAFTPVVSAKSSAALYRHHRAKLGGRAAV